MRERHLIHVERWINI